MLYINVAGSPELPTIVITSPLVYPTPGLFIVADIIYDVPVGLKVT